MTNHSTITRWLQQPGSFSENDRKEVASLLKTYPYFIPALYAKAGLEHQKTPFSPQLMDSMLLFRGNWLMLHEFLHAVKPAPDAAALGERTSKEGPAVKTAEPVAALVEDEPEIYTLGDRDIRMGDELEYIPGGKQEDTRENTGKSRPLPGLSKEELAQQQDIIREVQKPKEEEPKPKPDPLIQPIYSEDYFLHQGIQVAEELPSGIATPSGKDKSLMVVMSFSEWLMHFKTKGEKEKAEQNDQKALKTMWQKEKLAAAMEEENEEIPETVFEMAVNSITREEDLISESLAEILIRQGKYDKAIDMYQKLSLRIPQKNAYFARKINEIIKESGS